MKKEKRTINHIQDSEYMKKKLTLRVNEELINDAKNHGLNISAFVEIKLKEYLYNARTLDVQYTYNSNQAPIIKGSNFNAENTQEKTPIIPVKKENRDILCGRRELNPGRGLGRP